MSFVFIPMPVLAKLVKFVDFNLFIIVCSFELFLVIKICFHNMHYLLTNNKLF